MDIQKHFILLLATVFIFLSVHAQQLYTGEEKIVKNRITEEKYDLLRKILQEKTHEKLQDTIILKYDFNNETCWDMLDNQTKKYINSVLNSSRKMIDSIKLTRKGVSIFEYREKGKNINKLKKWNTSIQIDSSKQIFKILFDKKSICGNSAIILPDKSLIIIFSDSHFTSLFYDKEKILNILSSH